MGRFISPRLDLQKVKQLLGLKHVTISNFANKIFVYENIATTLHNHTYCVKSMLHLGIEHFNLVNRITCNTPVKKNGRTLSPEMFCTLIILLQKEHIY